MKYSSTSRPSRKLDLIGSSIVRPDVSAISPRIPASCLICWLEPRAPESAIMKMLLYLSRPLISLSVSSLSAANHVCTTAARISGFSFGTVISEIDTLNAPIVEYLYPRALILSRTSAVLVVPCTLIQRSRICFNCFLPH